MLEVKEMDKLNKLNLSTLNYIMILGEKML